MSHHFGGGIAVTFTGFHLACLHTSVHSSISSEVVMKNHISLEKGRNGSA